ncbi:MAG: hypothetical protein QOH41_2209 [Blastocatellia bacterium]|jgi:hypothetical protein|nr:hypothetical protein [Blastocatellia bacterium]
MEQDEYVRLKDILSAVAKEQKRVAYNSHHAERRFRRTEKAITNLLDAIKKRNSGK